jgi:biotin carboxyl carrier protein
MKLFVTVDGERFEVEIEDVRARPVVAVVDGMRYAVEVAEAEAASSAPPVVARPAGSVSVPVNANANANADVRQVLAPMPGVVVEVAVKPGDRVEPRQPLIVLESMKMKNIIRATVSATVEAVHVSSGQGVKHRDVLVTYGR